MRVAFLIPHFFATGPRSDNFPRALLEHGSFRPNSRAIRAAALDRAIFQIHSLFGQTYSVLDYAGSAAGGGRSVLTAPNSFSVDFDILVFTVAQHHVLRDLRCGERFFTHIETKSPPLYLGMECWRWMRDHKNEYDLFAYWEDDTIVYDAAFLAKIEDFNRRFGKDNPHLVLQPQRYEEALLSQEPSHLSAMARLYPDYTEAHEPLFHGDDISFDYFGRTITLEPARTAASGCCVLDKTQVEIVAQHRSFTDVMSTRGHPLPEVALLPRHSLKIYKPALDSLSYLEVKHGHQVFMRIAGDE